MQKFNFDLIRKAIQFLLDNPDSSNREVAARIGVSEQSIRHWKKQPFWQSERQKLINDRAELIGMKQAQERAEYKEKLRKQEERLEILSNQIFANSMRALDISNKVYATAALMDDPFKACSSITKAGGHRHAKTAIEGGKAFMEMCDHLSQIRVLIEYFDNLQDDELD